MVALLETLQAGALGSWDMDGSFRTWDCLLFQVACMPHNPEADEVVAIRSAVSGDKTLPIARLLSIYCPDARLSSVCRPIARLPSKCCPQSPGCRASAGLMPGHQMFDVPLPGYRVSGTHANPLGVKTDAPPEVVWDVMRAWVKQHPGKGPEPGSYAAKLLSREPAIAVNFSRAPGAVSAAKLGGLARFLPNPEANWGPKRKHSRPIKASIPTSNVKSQVFGWMLPWVSTILHRFGGSFPPPTMCCCHGKLHAGLYGYVIPTEL